MPGAFDVFKQLASSRTKQLTQQPTAQTPNDNLVSAFAQPQTQQRQPAQAQAPVAGAVSPQPFNAPAQQPAQGGGGLQQLLSLLRLMGLFS